MTHSDETEQQDVVLDDGEIRMTSVRHSDEAHWTAGERFGDLSDIVLVAWCEEKYDERRTDVVDVVQQECSKRKQSQGLWIGWESHVALVVFFARLSSADKFNNCVNTTVCFYC